MTLLAIVAIIAGALVVLWIIDDVRYG